MSSLPTMPRDQVEAARAVQHRRHAEPAFGQRMREGVEQRSGLRPIPIVADEELRRRADRDEGVAVFDCADADRRRPRHPRLRRQQSTEASMPNSPAISGRACRRLRFPPTSRGIFDRSSAACGEDGIGPVAARLVEPQGSGGVATCRSRTRRSAESGDNPSARVFSRCAQNSPARAASARAVSGR